MPSLSPRDVGTRVVLRHRLPLEGGRPTATDVIGVLEGWDGGVLRVRRADGLLVEVAESAVLAAKAVPARTLRRRDVRDLEAAAARAWRADEEVRAAGWLLRAAGGFTGRANSCLPLGPAPGPLPEAVAAVERWYDARGLPPRFQVPEPLEAGLSAHLDARGWDRFNPVLVLTAALAAVVDAVSAQVPPGLPPTVLAPAPDEDWLASYHYRGGALPPGARSVLERGDDLRFASVRDGPTVLAVARGAVTQAPRGARWLGVTAVEVHPAHRRRGLGTHVLGALAGWAGDRGATGVYVQVAEENAAARTAYARLGLEEHHRYHYRRRA